MARPLEFLVLVIADKHKGNCAEFYLIGISSFQFAAKLYISFLQKGLCNFKTKVKEYLLIIATQAEKSRKSLFGFFHCLNILHKHGLFSTNNY